MVPSKAGIFKFRGCSPRLAVSSRGPGDKNKKIKNNKNNNKNHFKWE